MRKFYEAQLELLNTELIEMGSLIETAIELATKALFNNDKQIAKKILEYKDEISIKVRNVESLCTRLYLQQQPVAGDLRLISSAMKIITDMERIGDQAYDISEMIVYLDGNIMSIVPNDLKEMSKETIKMVKGSIDAFVSRDLKRAKKIVEADDIVDDLFLSVREHITRNLPLNTDKTSQLLDIVMIDKYYEKIGDHAVNIAEWVIYSVTGLHKGVRL